MYYIVNALFFKPIESLKFKKTNLLKELKLNAHSIYLIFVFKRFHL